MLHLSGANSSLVSLPGAFPGCRRPYRHSGDLKLALLKNGAGIQEKTGARLSAGRSAFCAGRGGKSPLRLLYDSFTVLNSTAGSAWGNVL